MINERNQSNVRNPLYEKMTKDMNANPTVSEPIPSSGIGKRGGEGDKVFKPESTVPPRKKRHKKSIKKIYIKKNQMKRRSSPPKKKRKQSAQNFIWQSAARKVEGVKG